MVPAEEQKSFAQHQLHSFERFVEQSPDLAKDLVLRLVDSIKEWQRGINRDLILLVLFALLFELINRRLVGEFSTMGLKVAKLDFVKYLTPLAFAFTFLRMMFQALYRNATAAYLFGVTRRSYPELYRSNVINIVVPSGLTISRGGALGEFLGKGSNKTIRLVRNFESLLLLALLPIGFVAYSLTQLFRQGEPPFVGPTLVSIMSIFMMILGYLAFMSEPDSATDLLQERSIEPTNRKGRLSTAVHSARRPTVHRRVISRRSSPSGSPQSDGDKGAA